MLDPASAFHVPSDYSASEEATRLLGLGNLISGVDEEDLKVKIKKLPTTDYDIELASFFFFQLRHDERYHRDINNLKLIDRLKHLHNHIIKYKAIIDRKDENCGDISKEVTDAVIVCLSALVALGYGGYTTESLGDYYIKESVIRDEDIFYELGSISKILEGHDHVETLSYTRDLTTHFQRLFVKFLSIYYYRVDKVFFNNYQKRLYSIQERNPLHRKFVEHWGTIEL